MRARASITAVDRRTAIGRCVAPSSGRERCGEDQGSIFELVYRRLVVRLGHAQAIGAMAHRLCRLVWKILHDGVVYEERGPAVTQARAQRRAAKMIREPRSLGDRIDLVSAPPRSPA